jgi:hypothetical protein
MESGIALLRAICEGLSPSVDSDALPSSALRFVLEYAHYPDLDLQQARLSVLLDTNGFELKFLFESSTRDMQVVDGYGVFVVLQFPGLERTASQRALLRMGYALRSELNLVSVEPDLGSRTFADPEAPESIEPVSVQDGFEKNCWVDKQAPSELRWALENTRVLQAWQQNPDMGKGILIAQPDTGIASHAELNAASLRLDLGSNLVEGGHNPVDPLSTRTVNPGHGTGVASVVISGLAGRLAGSSPGASLIPIRCIDDVKVFNAAPVAAAIDHARCIGSHVISLSLGGVPGRAMRNAIKAAVRDDIIVVAAAGNCVGLVVWPARYSDVIAIGGNNIDDHPWQGSSHGADVDICAPAELVWRALRLPDDSQNESISGGQGTSYATALTAGIAALWLSHHGQQAVLRHARATGMSVQNVFRLALQQSARQPAGWNRDEYGAGIVDADALLSLPLQELNDSSVQSANDVQPDNATDWLLASLDYSSGSSTGNVDWRCFELEVAALLLNDARLGMGAAASAEKTTRARVLMDMTPELHTAVRGSQGAALQPLRDRRVAAGVSLMGPRLHNKKQVPLQNLATASGQALNSNPTTADGAHASLTKQLIRDKIDAMEQRFNKQQGAGKNKSAELSQLHRQVLQDTEQVLEKIQRGETIDATDVQANTALEALVKLEGRPAIELSDEDIDLNDPELGAWQGPVALLQQPLQQAQRSVGRIDSDGWHQGTGFVVAEGLILTNRHVLEAFAMPIPYAQTPEQWVFEQEPVIHFSPTADDPDRAFRITGVAFSGADPIVDGQGVDFDELDLALLTVESTNAAGIALPAALPVSTQARKTRSGSQVFVMGYPAQPQHFPEDEEGRLRLDVVERVRQIFGMRYGVRYLSPGLVASAADELGLGTRRWSFAHDATSLGGNSGSCVLSCDDDLAVVGLHFAGDWMRANYAHDMGCLKNASVGIPGLFE